MLATKHKIDTRTGADKLLPRLADNERVLMAAYDVVTSATVPGQRLVAAEAWLLDNFYIIEQQIATARRHLPRGYSRQLPRLANGLNAGFPRIYDLALELISHMDGRVDNDNATHIIAAYQTVQPLKIGELWAFPIMLQLALLENLRRVALRIAQRRGERETAIIWADRMLATAEKEPKLLIQLLAEFANADVPLTAPFVEEFYDKLQVQGAAMAFVQTWVEQKLLEQGVTATQLSETASRKAAANQISIANSIGSLRFIGAMDWQNYVESLSVVEQILLEDPANMYAAQDFATRDRYRHAVEDKARGSIHSELAVARMALNLAKNAASSLSRDHLSAHVGYYLVAQGQLPLEAAIGSNSFFKIRLKHISQNARLAAYLGPIFIVTVLLSPALLLRFAGLLWTDWRFWLLLLPSLIGISSLVITVVNLLVTLFIPPRVLPRLDFSKGIPFNHRTMVIVPTLISQFDEIDNLIEALEIRYLGNRDANLYFALLTDFRDASQRDMPEDNELMVYASNAIKTLNNTYCDDRAGIFYLFHRARGWNPYEKVWMGYERKRGKLEQFNALLRGEDKGAFVEMVGDMSILGTIKYVITLDTDTQLPRDTARTLVGNMAHPLNRPVYDATCGRIVNGYAILQPRASISLVSASHSWFTKMYAGEAGIDPYTREVSDVYQDIFGEGSFIGKGIYDVDAFRQAIDGRFPENLILSHDLLESGFARSALVTDVDLIEEHPASYAIEISRRHRWIRGDWQLAGWLLPLVPTALIKPSMMDAADLTTKRQLNPLTALTLWKIFDNLRRSLVSPALLLLLVGGWLVGSGAYFQHIWLWSLVVTAILLLPALLNSAIELMRKPQERSFWVHLHLTSRSASNAIMLALLSLILLPYDALICLDAIMRSGLRMLFTRRGLLLWHTKAYAIRNASQTCAHFFKEMWIAPFITLLLLVIIVIAVSVQLGMQMTLPNTLSLQALLPVWPIANWQALNSQALNWLLFSAPILLLWLASPAIAWIISKPYVTFSPALQNQQKLFLRTAARRTWRFFAQFVGPLDNWLAPDNFQEQPLPVIASRTSPTNIGMSLLANLAAYDFGYIAAGELLQLTENTLASMEKLERYRGHFYNWYDTLTLQPMHPRYVSSVDSGNLAGSLLTLQAGLLELKDNCILSSQVFQGLQDTFLIFNEHIPALTSHQLAQQINAFKDTLAALNSPAQSKATEKAWPQTLIATSSMIAELHSAAIALNEALPAEIAADSELFYWAQALLIQLNALKDDFAYLVPTITSASLDFNHIPSLAELAGAPFLTQTAYENTSQARLKLIDDLVARCQLLAMMDFEFLYDTSTNLLSIGFDVGERRRDPSCYDLLASEARLASFLLIAQGQLPQKHWFTLGRLLTSYGGAASLISWSGSMFEYLMPQLMMPSFENTLLNETCKAVVTRQIDYGKQRGVPWGISESCYNVTDMNQVYQYRAFGVPGLGFKRGLGEDLVIAPYASALALMVKPMEACRNLQLLASSGFLGMYGFYEAIDYTPLRLPRGKNLAVVRSFMAHHQGMSLLAFAYVLHNQPMQRRFMASPVIKATELLLHERIPKLGATLHPHAPEVSASARPALTDTDAIMRVFTDPNTPVPEVHLLSNGRYHVMTTNAGGGYSRWRDLTITRWREDATTDNSGTFIYLRDCDTGRYWSSAYQPTLRKADYYEAIFGQARAEFRRRDQAIEAHTEISISPEDDVEIRRLTLTNLSSRPRQIEITSYAEVVLAQMSADLSHRTFSNLFVQTEILPDKQGILCTRRKRSANEQVPWMFHLLAAPGMNSDAPTFETDRAKFIGRGRNTANPIVLDSQQFNQSTRQLSNTDGSVLDPIVAIRRNIRLSSDESATVQIISGVADSREAALALLDKYCDKHFVERAFEMAWFHSEEVLRHLNATESNAQIFGRLASAIIYCNPARRATPNVIARNQLGQSGLWRFGISGDLPIVLMSICDIERIELVKQLLQAHAYWRMKGLIVDLVIINEAFSSYRSVLQDQIMGLVNAGPAAQIIDKPGGVFIRRAEELSEEARVLLQAVSRIVINDTAETLLEQTLQIERQVSNERSPDRLFDRVFDSWQLLLQPMAEPVQPLLPRERTFCNGLGGFTPDGREYVITLEANQTTPAPWANVIASPHIGTVVSESGSAYTWVENAHEFRLSNWHNDPLVDNSGEAIYMRDEETGAFWSPTPLPAGGQAGYVCRHGFGYSVFEHTEAGIYSELTTYVAMDAGVKFVVVKLRNLSKKPRQLSLTGYWELVLGESRQANMMHIVTDSDAQTGALFARNAYSREYANRVFFAHVSESEQSFKGSTFTGNRAEFIGRNGSLASPAAMRSKRLSGKIGASLDPCAALQTSIALAEGQEQEIVFIIGAANNADDARHLIGQFGRPAGARQALEVVWDYWNRTLGAVQIETPDSALNVLANGWLLYQTLSSRLWGRSGYYQSGGAYGFRDQLQDTMALIHTTPWLAREQIIRCAERQFAQGDVQHWWHPPSGQGVRTHFSDDYLWLPYATCRYVMATGDTGVLNEKLPFLEGRILNIDEEANYDLPLRSTESASLYEHCVRAIKHGLRFGVHQLPLMGCGDWNDGMNLVGRDGKGESVWLAWFLYDNLMQFAELAKARDDEDFFKICKVQASLLRGNIETNAWDGAWYRRAYFDDGTPLGSYSNDECQIDSISQSWAVLSGGGDLIRARQAMTEVNNRLVDRDTQLIKLLTPPFDTSSLEPGYIKGYVPGVRENGGQYTHAAIWATMAFAQLGDKERAWELFGMLNPINHATTAPDMQRYKVEPYVMSADIYAAPPHTGRGGWTWYTGAAGWMYRLTLETLLGLHLEVNQLRITPRIPANWPFYKIHYRYRETLYHITVTRGASNSDNVLSIHLDSVLLNNTTNDTVKQATAVIPLKDDHIEHHVQVNLG